MKKKLCLHGERLHGGFNWLKEKLPKMQPVSQIEQGLGQVVDNEREGREGFGFSASTGLQNALQPEVNKDRKQGIIGTWILSDMLKF